MAPKHMRRRLTSVALEAQIEKGQIVTCFHACLFQHLWDMSINNFGHSREIEKHLKYLSLEMRWVTVHHQVTRVGWCSSSNPALYVVSVSITEKKMHQLARRCCAPFGSCVSHCNTEKKCLRSSAWILEVQESSIDPTSSGRLPVPHWYYFLPRTKLWYLKW